LPFRIIYYFLVKQSLFYIQAKISIKLAAPQSQKQNDLTFFYIGAPMQ